MFLFKFWKVILAIIVGVFIKRQSKNKIASENEAGSISKPYELPDHDSSKASDTYEQYDVNHVYEPYRLNDSYDEYRERYHDYYHLAKLQKGVSSSHTSSTSSQSDSWKNLILLQ